MSDAAAFPQGLRRGFPADRAALVVYLMAGYPDAARSLDALRVAASAGADVIELGVPYGDPLADGPTIREAADAARAAAPGGFGLKETVGLVREYSASSGSSSAPPIALMTYLNPMLMYGLPALARDAAEAGIAGFIVPDLPSDSPMSTMWRRAAAEHGIDTVFLAAPTSTAERLATVAAASSGFIYVVSSVGVTGERSELPTELADLVARVKRARAGSADPVLPVAVGFGVSTPAQAAAVARLADGVVVGSAIVRRQADPEAMGGFIAELAGAIAGQAAGASASDTSSR
jgi:tryptophan synthase alpha chain